MPVISSLTFTATDTTIVATWTTDVAADSNLFAGAKAAVDNGVAAASTSHQAIVAGLNPHTTYQCYVVSGGTQSTPQAVTTNNAQTKILATNVLFDPTAPTLINTPGQGDTMSTFISSDNNMYVTQGDGKGISSGASNTGANVQLDVFTDEVNLLGNTVNLMTSFGTQSQQFGTDGPNGTSMDRKPSGLFGLNGNLHMFVLSQREGDATYPTVPALYGNIVKSKDHGATWANWQNPNTFNANGSFAGQGQFEYANLNYGWASPVRYAADDGTLGYNTAGNQIDGANAYVYIHFFQSNVSAYSVAPSGQIQNDVFLMRIPRIQMDAQNASAFQYWVGPTSPSSLDFVNDANWSSSDTNKVSVFHSPWLYGWTPVTFIPGLNSYVMISLFETPPYGPIPSNSMYFLAAPTPAGPWSVILAQGSRSNGYYGLFPLHRDVVGNSATDNISLRSVFANKAVRIVKGTYTIKSSGMVPAAVQEFAQLANQDPISGGGVWTSVTGGIFSSASIKIASQYASADALNHNACSIYTGQSWPNDQYSEVTIGNPITAGGGCGPVARFNIAGTGYMAALNAAASASVVFRCVNGVATQIGSSFSLALVQDDVLRLTVTGQNPVVVTLTRNGTQVFTFSDSAAPISSGSPGINDFQASGPLGIIQFWVGGANRVATPTFSPDSGTYSGAQTVTVTSTTGATIYYTMDGTTPTHSSPSIISGGTISVAPGQKVKAIGSLSNFTDSLIGVLTFTSTAYSEPDCRNFGNFPNNSVSVNGTLQYTVQKQESRTSGAPVDSRISAPVASGTYPQNSRTPGTIGPGE